LGFREFGQGERSRNGERASVNGVSNFGSGVTLELHSSLHGITCHIQHFGCITLGNCLNYGSF
jgi:hypothetical protein